MRLFVNRLWTAASCRWGASLRFPQRAFTAFLRQGELNHKPVDRSYAASRLPRLYGREFFSSAFRNESNAVLDSDSTLELSQPGVSDSDADSGTNPQQGEAENALLELCQQIVAEPEKATALMEDWISWGNSLTPEKVEELDGLLTKRHEGGLKPETTGRQQNKALQKILKLVRKKNLVEISDAHLKRELFLSCRTSSPTSAIKLYHSFPKRRKTEHLTAHLIHVLLGYGPRLTLRTLKELDPKTAELWESMIKAYFLMDVHDKVLDCYNRMEEAEIKPTLGIYLWMLRYKRRLGGLEGIEDEARAALKEVDLHQADDVGRLMQLYGLLGDGDMVEEIWNMAKAKNDLRLETFVSALMGLGDTGRVELAEQALQDQIQHHKEYQHICYRKMIDIYAQAGMVEKAEQTMKGVVDLKHFPNSLILCYLAKNDTYKAVELMRDKFKKRVRRDQAAHFVNYESVLALLKVCETQPDARMASELVTHYLARHGGDTRIFNAFLRVMKAAKAKVYVPLLQKFRAKLDEESEVLLASLGLSSEEVLKMHEGNRQASEADGGDASQDPGKESESDDSDD